MSMLGKGVGDVGEAKGRSTTGSQFLEEFKTAQVLVQLAAQHSISGTTTTSSWDMGSTTQSLSLMQYDLKNLNDSTVHSPFTKHQPFTPSSTVMEVFLQEKPPAVLPPLLHLPPTPPRVLLCQANPPRLHKCLLGLQTTNPPVLSRLSKN